ncbi:MAG: ATP-binding protein [Actinomycetota bacterium]|nr:ATP-binding protein [Actinomycetota bacterium]
MKNYFQAFLDNLEKNRDKEAAPGASFTNMDSPQSSNRQVAARIAAYDSLKSAPRIIELRADDYDEFINLLATKSYQSSKEMGGNIPYTIIREIIENLIHAYFKEVVISILDNGNTVRISDQGPGIKHKEKAFEPGFSTATSFMKNFIRGVGSGLPITKETLSFLGGAITIEDNLESGTVVTLRMPASSDKEDNLMPETTPSTPKLNKRQKQVLFIIMEFGSVGPSKIASELNISLSTAYRDLVYLEEKSLISSDAQGKRFLTSLGIEYLENILGSSM